MKKILLTGDRPSGKLHLGHYVGSLQNRVKMQADYDSYIMIADVQALTDNFENPDIVQQSIYELAYDYLAIGIDPSIATIYIQSQIPEVAELTIYLMNLVTLSRLERNPTVKAELAQKGMTESIPVGFLCYPISQAADITAFGAEVIPVGEDQQPMIEQTNEIVRRFNRIYNTNILKECQAHIGINGRLPGIDGKNKASKSLGNAIFLSDEPAVVKEKVMSMFTDPNHLKVSDKGKVEGNVVFTYLDIFHQDKEEIADLKDGYRQGGVGDVSLKQMLCKDLDGLLAPIRERRAALSRAHIREILIDGTTRAQKKAQEMMQAVRNAMGINYFG
ncbi:MAG: tryptophan--tRNA ligase [Holosporales bacterium]|jgi:tryptophanyl-tRNA synthetase|nr:tryptophan--tRNA ligase [Holosporales bacterium]